jgi:hypothetical protein
MREPISGTEKKAGLAFVRLYRRIRKPAAITLVTLLIAAYIPNILLVGSFAEDVNTDFESAAGTEETAWEDPPAEEGVILSEPILAGDPAEEAPGIETEHDRESRTYQLSDGSYLTRIYAEPLTYTDANGREKDVDNTLVENGGEFVNKAASYEIALPKEGEGLSIRKDGYTLNMNPLSFDLVNAVAAENAIRYNEAAENIDVQYTAYASNIKEDIILKTPVPAPVFSYELVSDGLHCELRDNAVFLTAPNSEDALFVLTAPVMTDASGEISGAVALSLEQSGENPVMTVTPDTAWLSAPERVYPVMVDPTIALDSGTLEWHLAENGVSGGNVGAGPNIEHSGVSYLYVGFEDGGLLGMPGGAMYGQTESYLKINYDFEGMRDDAIVTAKLLAYKYSGRQPRRGLSMLRSL